MSDLKLVSPDQPTPLEQRLLDAVAHEAPSAAQRERVRLALGLPLVAPAPISAPPVARRALLLKTGGGLAAISVVAVALFIGLGRHSSSDERPAATQITEQAPASLPAIPVAAPAAPAVAAPPPSAVESAAPEPSSKLSHDDGPPSKRVSKAAAVESGADLSEQLRLIDAARAAVAAGNASGASAALSAYRTRFPRGPFGQEAAVLEIETLDLQGNHAEASARARRFLARHPNSPHVSVVKRIAGP